MSGQTVLAAENAALAKRVEVLEDQVRALTMISKQLLKMEQRIDSQGRTIDSVNKRLARGFFSE